MVIKLFTAMLDIRSSWQYFHPDRTKQYLERKPIPFYLNHGDITREGGTCKIVPVYLLFLHIFAQLERAAVTGNVKSGDTMPENVREAFRIPYPLPLAILFEIKKGNPVSHRLSSHVDTLAVPSCYLDIACMVHLYF